MKPKIKVNNVKRPAYKKMNPSLQFAIDWVLLKQRQIYPNRYTRKYYLKNINEFLQ